MSLTPSQIKQIVRNYLDVLYDNVSSMDITFLVKAENTGHWKVNIRFEKSGTLFPFSIQALLRIDGDGDVVEFKEGYVWRY